MDGEGEGVNGMVFELMASALAGVEAFSSERESSSMEETMMLIDGRGCPFLSV